MALVALVTAATIQSFDFPYDSVELQLCVGSEKGDGHQRVRIYIMFALMIILMVYWLSEYTVRSASVSASLSQSLR